LAYFKEYSSSF